MLEGIEREEKQRNVAGIVKETRWMRTHSPFALGASWKRASWSLSADQPSATSRAAATCNAVVGSTGTGQSD